MANQSTTGVSPDRDTHKYFAERLCTPAQMVNEAIAWSDARQYARALASWRPNGSFQPAMDLYMGTDSFGPLTELLEGMTSEMKSSLIEQREPPCLRRVLTKALLANIDGALRVHDLSTWPDRQRLFVFCDEPAPFAARWNICKSNEVAAFAYV